MTAATDGVRAVPESEMRTVHLRVTYRMQIPADVPVARCMVDRKVELPPMRYSTGAASDASGGPGTWMSHPLVADFLTYQERWGEGDGWDSAEKVEALRLRSERGPCSGRLGEHSRPARRP